MIARAFCDGWGGRSQPRATVDVAGPPAPLDEFLLAVFAGVGAQARQIFDPSNLGSLSLVDGKIATATNLGTDTGNDPRRLDVASRPVYDATGINGFPCAVFAGNGNLTTPSTINCTTDISAAILAVVQDDKVALSSAATFGLTSSPGNGSVGTTFNRDLSATSSGRIGAQAGGLDLAVSAASYPLDAPALVSILYDRSAAPGGKLTVYHNNLDVTEQRSELGGTGALGANVWQLGSGVSTMIGKLGGAVFATSPTPIPEAAVLSAGARLMSRWGIS